MCGDLLSWSFIRLGVAILRDVELNLFGLFPDNSGFLYSSLIGYAQNFRARFWDVSLVYWFDLDKIVDLYCMLSLVGLWRF